MRAEFFHTDGQTDMANLIVAFRNFSNAPEYIYHVKTNYQSLPPS
jgi:hypothetical protein